MRARYLGKGVIDNYKGVSLKSGCEFEVTDAMRTAVLAGPTLFQVIEDIPEEAQESEAVKRKPGRPRKSDENAV